MPLTTLDPTAALVVIDLQRGVLALPVAQPVDDIVRNAAALAAAFRRRNLPVVLVRATGRAPGRTDAGPSALLATRPADWADLVDELDVSPSDLVVTKQTWGAFTATSLDDDLRARGVTQVVLAGIATSAGVESTARNAHELGYHVVLVTDAMADGSEEVHRHSVGRVFPRIGETTTTQVVLDRLTAER